VCRPLEPAYAVSTRRILRTVGLSASSSRSPGGRTTRPCRRRSQRYSCKAFPYGKRFKPNTVPCPAEPPRTILTPFPHRQLELINIFDFVAPPSCPPADCSSPFDQRGRAGAISGLKKARYVKPLVEVTSRRVRRSRALRGKTHPLFRFLGSPRGPNSASVFPWRASAALMRSAAERVQQARGRYLVCMAEANRRSPPIFLLVR